MLPLDDVRILDLSRLAPGPFCTMLLGDLGADVLLIEPPPDSRAGQIPGGDDPYNALGRNKRSIILNLRDDEAREVFVRLADLTGDLSQREHAVWAMKSFPNSHRQFGAFAAGFGHALGRLLALPLAVTVAGEPGSAEVRALARAALTQLGHGDVILRFRREDRNVPAKADIQLEGRPVGSITRPEQITPEMVKYLGQA